MIPIPKQVHASQLHQSLVSALDITASFAAAGTYVEAIGVLDEIVPTSQFGVIIRDRTPIRPIVNLHDEGSVVRDLADLLRRLDRAMPDESPNA